MLSLISSNLFPFLKKKKQGQEKRDTFKIYPDDTFLVSYPRSGNSWTRFLITNIKYHGKEFSYHDMERVVPDMYKVSDLDKCEFPRIIKSHEVYQKEYPKVIYIYRDGRDVTVSYYFFYKQNYNYNKSFEIFLKEMLDGKVAFGSWHEHIKSWLFKKHDIPFLPVRYEALCSNTLDVLNEVVNFLNIKADEHIIREAIKKSTPRNLNNMYLKAYPEKRPEGYDENKEVKTGPGKWKIFFNSMLLDVFWAEAGEVMEKLGYKK